MNLIHKLSNTIESKTSAVLVLVCVFGVFGTILEISGGIWDALSHLLKEPELFWTIQHITVYTGVSMIATSGILGSIILKKNSVDKKIRTGIKIIIIGSFLQISAGYADSISHDIYGVDGLISWSHQFLEVGLVLGSLGAYLILKNLSFGKLKKLLPLAVMTLIFSIIWIGFNLSLLAGSTILCLPFYQIFSSGCAVM